MADITEYGNIMLNAYIDEWGRRRINGLLEDGVKVIVAVGLILKQWSQTGVLSHVFRHHKTFRLTQTLKVLKSWTLPVPTFLKRWNAALQAAHAPSFPMRVIRLPKVLQLSHSFSRPSRLFSLFERLGLLYEFYAGKPSAKKAKLFLVLGDLAIQLSND